MAKLRQFGENYAGQDRTCTGHTLQQGGLLLPDEMGLALWARSCRSTRVSFRLQPCNVALGYILTLSTTLKPE